MLCYFKQAKQLERRGPASSRLEQRRASILQFMCFSMFSAHHTVYSNNMKTFKMTADEIQ